MEQMDAESPRLRLSILGLVVFSLFGALFARVWFLQVMAADQYEQVVTENRLRVIAAEAPRGRILDAQGRVLVDNRTSLVVAVDKTVLAEMDDDERADLLTRLAHELTDFGVPSKVARIERRLADPQYSPLQPVPVAIDVPEALQIYLAERSDRFPGITVERESVRAYPHGDLASHVIGYVGRISQSEFEARMGSLEDPDLDVAKPYQPDSSIGKTGVEQVYEDDLRGTPGLTEVEVDAEGRVVRTVERTPPVPGNDVQLTIDIDVQANAEEQLARQLEGLRGSRTRDGKTRETPAGSVVVQHPDDGAIVAMASYPTYDPAEFVNGISAERFDALNSTEPERNPFTNRAIGGLYAPGSTFKPFTAHAALEAGIITPDFAYNDTGSYTIEGCSGPACTRTNAGAVSNGIVDLRSALTVSSDTYFYRIGDAFYRRRSELGDGIQSSARLFGFGEPTGLPLSGDLAGVIPDPAWKRQLYDALPPEQQANGDPTWYAGDNVNLSIGQGDVLVSPLQLNNAYAALANGGELWTPRVASRVLRGGADPADPDAVVRVIEPELRRTIEVPADWWSTIQAGLAGVTTERRGTARSVFDGWDHEAWPIASKTGTAEVDRRADFALFAAYGPLPDSEYVVTAILEEAGFGAEAAAPVVRRVLEPLAGQTEAPAVDRDGDGDIDDDDVQLVPDGPVGD